MTENKLLTRKNVLICVDEKTADLTPSQIKELEFIKNNFCGTVLTNLDNIPPNTLVYLCGDIEKIWKTDLPKDAMVLVLKDFSFNYETIPSINFVSIGEMPINVHNVGLYFRKFFPDKNYFDSISTEHKFQTLTESNKASNAFRKGIYLTKVHEREDGLGFNLLRCSTNLNGPTENFRTSDNDVVGRVNDISKHFFEKPTEMNHVLAQIYENSKYKVNNDTVEKKAKISAHSDKTKDMPADAVMAFCTFYKFDDKVHLASSSNDSFDKCHSDISVLTKLHFVLKKEVNDDSLVKEFTVTLYPNSAFMIPLSTNRLYTHEIKPSIVSVDKIPVRLGYVVRCSKTKAVFKDGQTYIDENGTLTKLEEITKDDIVKIRELYLKENKTTEIVNYGSIYCSMNDGDYTSPLV
jgi:hypothetical protein